MDEEELERLEFEAGHDYNVRLATLVHELREHRRMLKRYLTAHAMAAQAGPDQLPAAIKALLEAYHDAWKMLGEPAPTTMPESSTGWVTVSQFGHLTARGSRVPQTSLS
ncbi:MAG: hypothetical protein ACHQ0J_01380 [Candidatus Dormibacterales bacterium]